MGQVEAVLGGLTGLGIAAIALAAVGSLVWLVGLIVVTRGSKPSERPHILRAYGGVAAKTVVRSSEALQDRQRRRDK